MSMIHLCFWRTYDGQEIDLLEINSNQQIQAIECKWGASKAKIPAAFAKAYPSAKWAEINKDNVSEWIIDYSPVGSIFRIAEIFHCSVSVTTTKVLHILRIVLSAFLIS